MPKNNSSKWLWQCWVPRQLSTGTSFSGLEYWSTGQVQESCKGVLKCHAWIFIELERKWHCYWSRFCEVCFEDGFWRIKSGCWKLSGKHNLDCHVKQWLKAKQQSPICSSVLCHSYILFLWEPKILFSSGMITKALQFFFKLQQNMLQSNLFWKCFAQI